jgi:hypothetical protein
MQPKASAWFSSAAQCVTSTIEKKPKDRNRLQLTQLTCKRRNILPRHLQCNCYRAYRCIKRCRAFIIYIVPVQLIKELDFGTAIKRLRFIFYPHSKKFRIIKNSFSNIQFVFKPSFS